MKEKKLFEREKTKLRQTYWGKNFKWQSKILIFEIIF